MQLKITEIFKVLIEEKSNQEKRAKTKLKMDDIPSNTMLKEKAKQSSKRVYSCDHCEYTGSKSGRAIYFPKIFQ